ncbi:MAG: 3-deoxy-manno-octulosonate cytidylyltransferase, partial [Gemmatimonadaceae bacterium]
MRTVVVIPARFGSTRLPGKPLADLGGKPMVVRVAERARASGAMRVVVATDDSRIEAAASAHGVEAIMTRADHASGTDRLAEAATQLGLCDDEIVVNVQGDEPLVDPRAITAVANLVRQGADMATAARPLEDGEAEQASVVKVVLDHRGRALYFSRSPIPYPRGEGEVPPLAHLGIYG